MGLIPVFPGNPRQGWQFLVRVTGFEAGYFQKATLPEIETEIDEFNPAGSVRPTKFAGRIKIGDCVLEKGMPADQSDRTAWSWLTTAVDPVEGNLGNPSEYRRTVEICHVNRLGVPVQTWILEEAFCSKIEWSDNEGGSSEHIVETLTLTVGNMRVI